jgi:hypothetical protein
VSWNLSAACSKQDAQDRPIALLGIARVRDRVRRLRIGIGSRLDAITAGEATT